MQLGKQLEHLLGVFRRDARSVIGHRQRPFFSLGAAIDGDRRRAVVTELHRVVEQLLEQLRQQRGVGGHNRQRPLNADQFAIGITLGDGLLCGVDHCLQID